MTFPLLSLRLLHHSQGAIEFMIPEGKFPGDLVTLQSPEGVAMPIEIPENTTPGSFLQVAYPVAVLPPNDDEAVDHEGECCGNIGWIGHGRSRERVASSHRAMPFVPFAVVLSEE